MSSDRPSPLWFCWRHGWPAFLFVGAAAFFWVVAAVGEIPGLRERRVSEIATFGGVVFLIVLGLPLLVAWGLWSALGIRRWAARSGLYAGLVVADFGVFVWLFLNSGRPQM